MSENRKKNDSNAEQLMPLAEKKYNKIFYEVLCEVCDNSRFNETKQYIQHGDTSVYEHCINVAYTSMIWAVKTGHTKHLKELIRGALLHDYFLYDWHEKSDDHKLHGFFHPQKAFQNAKKDFKLTKREENIIVRHMFPLTVMPPSAAEAYFVCAADKLCSVLETLYHKKLRHRFSWIVLESHQWRYARRN